MIFWELFTTFFVIGMFTIGGGYAMLSLIQNEVVTVHGWIDETTFTIDGVTNLEEVEELTGVEIPEGSYDTLAGFIIKNLGFLPQEGEVYEVIYENLKFTVLEVDERRIEKVRVEITPVEEENEESEYKLFNRDRDKKD